jgi:hypothetical protein
MPDASWGRKVSPRLNVFCKGPSGAIRDLGIGAHDPWLVAFVEATEREDDGRDLVEGRIASVETFDCYEPLA